MSYGNLNDVKKVSDAIQPARGVKVSIELEQCAEKDGAPRTWKFFKPTYTLVDGIIVDGEFKNKGRKLFGSIICYFADLATYEAKQEAKGSDAYDFVGKNLKKCQHLIETSQIAKALGLEIEVSEDIGISDLAAAEIAEKVKGQYFTVNIGQKKENGETINTVTGIKACSVEELV